MEVRESNKSNAATKFWDNYINIIIKQGVKESAARWYFKRAEHYIASFKDRKLALHTAGDVNGYLAELGRDSRLADWQFAQAADAIRNLFLLIRAPWLEEVDWQYWKQFSSTLTPEHPTLAREVPADRSSHDKRERYPAAFCVKSGLQNDVVASVVAAIRCRHYSIRTEKAYCQWVVRFIGFVGDQHPLDVGAAEVSAFLEELALKRNVAASTQNQALNALVFLYGEVLGRPLGELGQFAPAKRPKRLPVVLTRTEVSRLINSMTGTSRLMAALLYGTGMRLVDCVRMRVQDIDFEYQPIVLRDGKGGKDRVVPLPKTVVDDLQTQLANAKALHAQDLERGFGEVFLPNALAHKYPNAPKEWRWQYVLPSSKGEVTLNTENFSKISTLKKGVLSYNCLT